MVGILLLGATATHPEAWHNHIDPIGCFIVYKVHMSFLWHHNMCSLLIGHGAARSFQNFPSSAWVMRWYAKSCQIVPKTLHHRKFTENPVLIQFVSNFHSIFLGSHFMKYIHRKNYFLITGEKFRFKVGQKFKILLNLELREHQPSCLILNFADFSWGPWCTDYSKISQTLHKISINNHVKFGEVPSSILPKLRGMKFCQSSGMQNSLKSCNFTKFDLNPW